MKTVARCLALVLIVAAGGLAEASARSIGHAATPYAVAARTMRSAERGDVRAQAQLGWMYATGRGLPQNYFEAAKWYYRAADRGNGWAQLELGLLYNKGQGVPRDYVLAYMWMNLSASQAVGNDRDFIAKIRDSVASNMTPPQLVAAQQMSSAWYHSH